MFFHNQDPVPPQELKPPVSSNGIEINIRLSETILTHFLRLLAALLVGSGFIAHAQSTTFPTDNPSNVEVEALDQD